MRKIIRAITADKVTVVDRYGQLSSTTVRLTPCGQDLTQWTKRDILASGCLRRRYGKEAALDEDLRNEFLEFILRQVLACRESEER